MKTCWSKGLDTQQKQDINGNFISSSLMRKRLIVLLNERKQTSMDASNKKHGYDSPNWAYQQADSRGYERALEDIIELIKQF